MHARILVVDDEPAVASMLRLVLETYAYSVTVATSATEAVMRLNENEFDAVVTDMKMETDTSGYDVVRAAVAKAEKPAIIILTAFPLLARQWREAGAHAALAKPVHMDNLLRTVAELLEQRSAQR